MPVILRLDKMPPSCLDCPLNYYETTDEGENLSCIPLFAKDGEEVQGNFLKRLEEYPLEITIYKGQIKEAADILDELIDVADLKGVEGRMGVVRISSDEAIKLRELITKLRTIS